MSDQQPIFAIEKIYVKDLSLEIPNAPRVFLDREAPEINIQLNNQDTHFDGDFYEVQLTITVTAKLKENVMFLVEIHQAGIFRIKNIPEKDMGSVLGVVCPNILFPYLRESVSDTVIRAGFPPVLLNPVNFEAIYLQKQQQGNTTTTATQQVPGAEKIH